MGAKYLKDFIIPLFRLSKTLELALKTAAMTKKVTTRSIFKTLMKAPVLTNLIWRETNTKLTSCLGYAIHDKFRSYYKYIIIIYNHSFKNSII